MPGNVFVSCGQKTKKERYIASRIKTWLAGAQFKPYVSIQDQSLRDLNQKIISELKSTDYFILIDFKRERISLKKKKGKWEYRGSLYTNQELAITSVLGFDDVLLFKQNGVKLEGMSGHMLANAVSFLSPKMFYP